MATEPPSNPLPIFYGGLEPLSSSVHAGYRSRSVGHARRSWSSNHAVPITVDEFVAVQRYFPIVFSVGENPVPLALMGLNEGVNVFVDDEGKLLGEVYLPAYVRRYPFMLARLSPGRPGAVALLRPDQRPGRRVRRGRAAVRRRQAERDDQRHPQILRGVRAFRPAHRRLHEGAEGRRAC